MKQPTRWEFMKGIFFEQFDEKFRLQVYIQADTAWYFDQMNLWKLRGRVSIRNVDGLIYRGEELYWDGTRHEFYSNVYSQLITPERTIEGTYFRSDEAMTRYTVSNSKGSFVAEDIDGSDGTNGTNETSGVGDTASVAPTVRPAQQKHATGR
jgi:hypothetical protein